MNSSTIAILLDHIPTTTSWSADRAQGRFETKSWFVKRSHLRRSGAKGLTESQSKATPVSIAPSFRNVCHIRFGFLISTNECFFFMFQLVLSSVKMHCVKIAFGENAFGAEGRFQIPSMYFGTNRCICRSQLHVAIERVAFVDSTGSTLPGQDEFYQSLGAHLSGL